MCTPSLLDVPTITADMARELALAQKVCIRPLLRRVHDRQAGTEDVVALPCGSTREAMCPPCAHKARMLRMQQCQEGWHRTDEPEHQSTQPNDDQADDEQGHDDGESERRVRSTRRRQDAPDLPRVPQEDRTVGRVFATPDGREYRPSMFLTLTMPSYGPVTSSGVPADPDHYNYRRQALDALHFARLVDRFWQNLRRAAGYKVQYFAAVEPQRRWSSTGERSESAGPAGPLTTTSETTASAVGEIEPRHDRSECVMEKLLLTPQEAAECLGVSRSQLYELMRRHEVLSILIGRSRRIPAAPLREYVQRLAEDAWTA